jgi:hypothetical protein
MRKASSARLLFIVVASMVFSIPQVSHAYLDRAWLVGTDVELIQGPGTIRLAGMGNLTVAVEDENNQVNLYDFTGNVASLIFDKATHNSDTWASYSKWADEKDGIRWQDIGVWEGGTQAVLRGEGVYAGGASVSTWTLDFVRVDDELLRSSLRVAYPKSEIAYTDSTLIDMEVAASAVEAYYARKIMDKVYLGMRGWGVFESEERPLRLRYEITNSAEDIGTGLGLVVWPVAWMQVGGTFDLGSQLVEAASQDPFHDDLYSTKRSIPSYSTHVAFYVMEMLRCVVNYKHYSYEADQTLVLNWAAEYIVNPEPSDIHLKLKVGTESLDSDFLATRLILSRPGFPLKVSGYFDRLTEGSWYEQAPNALVWTEDYDQFLDEWNLVGGASYELPRRALVGVEVRFNRGRLENRLSVDEDYTNFKALDLRGGGEYRLLPWLVLRGGYARSTEERFMGVPEENFASSTISAGLGCLLKDERLAIDAAFSHTIIEPEEDLGVDRLTRYQGLMLYGRFTF